MLHPNWWTRYVYGFFSTVSICTFTAEQYYNIPRCRDPNIKWNWWLEFMHKKRTGEIERDMPGYMYMKWNNNLEKNWWANHPKSYPGFEPSG